MGRYVFKLPDVGEGTAEAEIVAWHVNIGEKISEDQHLVDVMTDKATVEMTSPVTGTVVSLHGTPGEMAVVGAPLVELDVEGAGNAPAGAAKTEARPESPKQTPVPPPKTITEKAATKQEPRAQSGTGETRNEPTAASSPAQAPAFATRMPGTKPLASPAVRRRAEELGIQLQFVPGSGPAG